MDDKPQPPAAAYAVMVGLLPADYFRTAPPKRGARLTVVGNDGKPTQWDMSELQAKAVLTLLDRRAALARCIRAVEYDDDEDRRSGQRAA
jgi:hypothetical protein